LPAAVVLSPVTTQFSFDADLVTAAAERHGVSESVLRTLLSRHQSIVHENPGADSLVYEWRKYHPGDPLVARSESWYVCAVRPTVWAEFASVLDTGDSDSDAPLDAVRAVHDGQARRLVDDHAPFEDREAMVLERA
jgi:hypothetical protein